MLPLPPSLQSMGTLWPFVHKLVNVISLLMSTDTWGNILVAWISLPVRRSTASSSQHEVNAPGGPSGGRLSSLFPAWPSVHRNEKQSDRKGQTETAASSKTTREDNCAHTRHLTFLKTLYGAAANCASLFALL